MGEEKAPATVRCYVSSISSVHRAAGMANPTEATAVKLALKRLHRANGRAQAQAGPLNRRIVDRALVAVAYDTLARRSELVALQVEDIQAGKHAAGSLLIRRSKVDQEGVGEIRYLAPDTMRTLRAWCPELG